MTRQSRLVQMDNSGSASGATLTGHGGNMCGNHKDCIQVVCIDAHTKRAVAAGATDPELGEVIFVAMAMAAGAAWSHGGLMLQCRQEHAG